MILCVCVHKSSWSVKCVIYEGNISDCLVQGAFEVEKIFKLHYLLQCVPLSPALMETADDVCALKHPLGHSGLALL